MYCLCIISKADLICSWESDQRHGLYLCFDMTEIREMKLALFKTLVCGVSKLLHHGLLAAARGANKVSMTKFDFHTSR